MNDKTLIISKFSLKGSSLKRLLKERGITKWRLAKDCDISYRTIQYWEKGKTVPSDENFKKVSEYLGLPRHAVNNGSSGKFLAIEQRLNQHEERIKALEHPGK